MAANFNFSAMKIPSDAGGVIMEVPALLYKDANGTEVEIPSLLLITLITTKLATAVLGDIAETYTKKTYSANSLVIHNNSLFYNPNAINTAENWTAAHWNLTTVADYIKLMTTT